MRHVRMQSWRNHPAVTGAEVPQTAAPRREVLPKKGRYGVRGSGMSFVVINYEGAAISRGYTSHRDAELLAVQLNTQAEVEERFGPPTRRACMCCGKAFDSEGIHNRMCDYCRRVGHAPVNW